MGGWGCKNSIAERYFMNEASDDEIASSFGSEGSESAGDPPSRQAADKCGDSASLRSNGPDEIQELGDFYPENEGGLTLHSALIDHEDYSYDGLLPPMAANPDQDWIDGITAQFRNGARIVPPQCRSARALLGITQAELARRAGVSLSTVVDFERERRPVVSGFKGAISYALRSFGIILIDEDVEGPGVRLQKIKSV